MNITIKTNKLQPVLYALNQADDEGFLIFKEDGLEAVVTDPAMVLMEEAKIDEDQFENYEPEIEEHEDLQFEEREGLHIGINYDLLYKILKQQSSTDRVDFSIEQSEVVIDVDDNRFEVPILNLSTEDIPDITDLDFEGQAKIKVKNFKSALDNLALFSDASTITLTEDTFEMYSDGNMGNTNQEVYLDGFEDLREAEEDEELEDLEVRSMYALDYLQDIRKACAKLSSNRNKVEFSLADDFPLQVECDKGGKYVKFVVAPRIEEED